MIHRGGALVMGSKPLDQASCSGIVDGLSEANLPPKKSEWVVPLANLQFRISWDPEHCLMQRSTILRSQMVKFHMLLECSVLIVYAEFG